MLPEKDHFSHIDEIDRPRAEMLLAEMNKIMQVQISPDDPCWQNLSEYYHSPLSGVFARFNFLGDSSGHFKASEERPNSNAVLSAWDIFRREWELSLQNQIHTVSFFGKPGQGKSYSGDMVGLHFEKTREWYSGEILIKCVAECLDGVTDLSEKSVYQKLMKRLKLLVPDIESVRLDCIANQVLAALEPLMAQYSVTRLLNEKSSSAVLGRQFDLNHPFLNALTLEEMRRAREYHEKPELLSHPCIQKWRQKNLWLGLAFGVFLGPEIDYSGATFPGTTGNIMLIGETSRNVVTIHTAPIADSVDISVLADGQVYLSGPATNTRFDMETLTKIRKMLQTGEVTSVAEAQQKLSREGYYAASYKRKRTSSKEGVVPVCDGNYTVFDDALYSSGAGMSTSALIIAKITLSDGMLAPFINLDRSLDKPRFIQLIEMILRHDPRSARLVEDQEQETFLDPDGLPNREKLSDDKSGMCFAFRSKKIIEEVIQSGLSIL